MYEKNIAVVGAGGWGANHVRTWAKLGLLHTVCDPDPRRLEAAGEIAPGVELVSSFEQMLDNDDLKGVVLATPAPLHAEMAIAAMEHGKDVLIEKPLALEVADGEKIEAAVQRTGQIAMVGHVLEYHPAVIRLSELIQAGDLGDLRYVYSNRLNFGKIRTHEDTMWSFAPHDIALLLRFVGTGPSTVSARGGSYVTNTVADATMMTLGFPNGVEGHIFVSWLHPFKEQRLVLVGSKAMAVFDDTLDWSEKLSLYRHDIEWHGGEMPEARKADREVVELEEAAPLEQECIAFASAIHSRVQPRASTASGLETLKVLEAGARSMEDGGRPIEMAAGPDKAPYYSHPTAAIDEGAVIGEGSKIWHGAHVMSGAVLGSDCNLGQNVYVGATARIGHGARIQNNVSVYDGVTLGERVFCGPSMVFTNVLNPRAGYERKDEYLDTKVGDGASIGANATIVCGNDVGEYAMVAAGAVVVNDVPDHALVMGVPARIAGWVSHAGRVLEFDDEGSATCGESGMTYVLADEGRLVASPTL